MDSLTIDKIHDASVKDLSQFLEMDVEKIELKDGSRDLSGVLSSDYTREGNVFAASYDPHTDSISLNMCLLEFKSRDEDEFMREAMIALQHEYLHHVFNRVYDYNLRSKLMEEEAGSLVVDKEKADAIDSYVASVDEGFAYAFSDNMNNIVRDMERIQEIYSANAPSNRTYDVLMDAYASFYLGLEDGLKRDILRDPREFLEDQRNAQNDVHNIFPERLRDNDVSIVNDDYRETLKNHVNVPLESSYAPFEVAGMFD